MFGQAGADESNIKRVTTGFHTYSDSLPDVPSNDVQSSRCCVARNGDAVFGWILNLCSSASTIRREEDVEIEIPSVNCKTYHHTIINYHINYYLINYYHIN